MPDLRSLADVDPYPTFAKMGTESTIHWDGSVNGWLVTGYDECNAILRDPETFVMAWTDLDGGEVALGKYGIFNLRGDLHEQMHKDLLDFFNPVGTSSWRR